MTTPAAIVLAAGEGRRMGGPKALLVVDGEPLIRRHVDRLREVGCRSIVVVVRPAVVAQVAALLRHASGVRIVGADTPSPAASLTTGLRALEPEPDAAIVVTPVDTLPAQPSTIDALLTSLQSEGVCVATPRYRGRGGHPVVVRASLLRVFVDGYRGTLRDVIRDADAHRLRLDVDDAAIQGDLDTPADLGALRFGLVPSFAVGQRV